MSDTPLETESLHADSYVIWSLVHRAFWCGQGHTRVVAEATKMCRQAAILYCAEGIGKPPYEITDLPVTIADLISVVTVFGQTFPAVHLSLL